MEVTKLNDIRKRMNMSFEELSTRANLPKSTVEKVLFGIVKNPRIDTLQAIERALGIEEEKTPPGEDLSEGEKILLDLFNRVPEEKQELLLQLIRTALEMQ